MAKTGVTIIELLVVLIVLGILATLGFAQRGAYKENTLDKEACANLQLIVAAEKVYRLEAGGYWDRLSNNEINTGLRMLLPVGAWNYSASTTCVQASRNKGTVRHWRQLYSEDKPVKDQICP